MKALGTLLLLQTIFLLLLNAESKVIILTSDFPPMVHCTAGERGNDFKGIDMDLFRDIAGKLKWTNNEWEFMCINFEKVNDEIKKTDFYLGYIGGATITLDRQQQGFVFSQSTMNTGLTVLVRQTEDQWTFLKVFTIEIVLVLIFTAFFIALLQYFLEGRHYSLEYYMWHMFASIFLVNQLRLMKFSSRIIMISFWFMILIITSTYTAYMTTIKSVDQMLNGVTTVNDLNQKKVKTYSIYFDTLYNYGAKPINNTVGGYENLPVDTITDDMVRKDLSRTDSSKIDAFVLDDPFASIVEYESCEIYRVSRVFQPFSYGIMYWNTQQKHLMENINTAIGELSDSISSAKRVTDYMKSNLKQCVKSTKVNKITVFDIAGLWYILAGAAGLSIVIYLLSCFPFSKKVAKFLERHKILEQSVENDGGKKIGDDLIVQNLKEVTYKLMHNLQEELKEKLEEVDERVSQFYEVLSQNNEQEKEEELEVVDDLLTPKKQEDVPIISASATPNQNPNPVVLLDIKPGDTLTKILQDLKKLRQQANDKQKAD